MKYSFETLQSRFTELPEDVQIAISSSKIVEDIQEIGGKYKLHVDILEKLFNETGGVLFGVLHPKDYVSSLSKELNVDVQTAKLIAEDVNEKIFKPIRESLKKVHSIEGGEKGEEEKAPKIPTIQSQKKVVGDGAIKVSAQEKDVPANKKSDFAIAVEKKIAATQAPVGIPHSKDEDILPKTEEAKKIEGDIIGDKLTKKFQMPQEDSSHEATEDKEKEEAKTEPEVTSYDIDPYREPLD